MLTRSSQPPYERRVMLSVETTGRSYHGIRASSRVLIEFGHAAHGLAGKREGSGGKAVADFSARIRVRDSHGGAATLGLRR